MGCTRSNNICSPLSLSTCLNHRRVSLKGYCWGVKAVIPTDLKDDLTQTGLTHIIVVSGYNMAVVATLLQRLTEKRMRRSLALLVALVGVAVFTLMTGGSAPVVRAAVMVSMTLLARARRATRATH